MEAAIRSLAPLLRGEGEEKRIVSVYRHNSPACRNRDAIPNNFQKIFRYRLNHR